MDREERRARREEEAQARRAARVQVIVDLAWQFRDSETPLGDALVAQRLGIYQRGGRFRDTIRGLMAEARETFARQYPGYSITRPGLGLITITDDPDDRQLNREIQATIRTRNTKDRRLVAQAGVWRAHSTDPAQQHLAALIETHAMLGVQLERAAEEVSVTAAS